MESFVYVDWVIATAFRFFKLRAVVFDHAGPGASTIQHSLFSFLLRLDAWCVNRRHHHRFRHLIGAARPSHNLF